MTRKLVVTDDRGTRELLLVGTMGVGRDPACEISVDDPLLSRRHAEFRVSPEGVVVTDLDSRNGLRVNGVSTRRAVLRDGDEIRIAALRIQLVDRPAPQSAAEAPDEDGTIVIPAPLMGGAPTPARVASAQGYDADDRTIVRLPPMESAARPSPQQLRVAPPRARLTKRFDSPVSEPAPGMTAIARTARTSWSGRVFVQVVGLAIFAAALVAVLMWAWQARMLNGVAVARATALVNWLAADAANARERGDISGAVEGLAREPGVVSAIVLGLDGRVLSPPSRAGEAFGAIPGLDAPPSEIYRLRSGVADGLVQVARPISNRQGARQAVAWVSFRPSAGPDEGSVIVVLGPAFFAVFAAAMFIASSVRRTTLRGLALLNEDIELAIGGQLEAVKDPLGARPIRDLADTVNYLIARARAAGPMSVGAAKAAGWAHDRRMQPAGITPRPRDAAVTGSVPSAEARIVADAKFRVTSASPECATLIGVAPKQMLGEHLVDALQSKQLVEAVLTCLGEMPAAGERRVVLALDGRPLPLAIVITRTGKDQPVTITFRQAESAVPA